MKNKKKLIDYVLSNLISDIFPIALMFLIIFVVLILSLIVIYASGYIVCELSKNEKCPIMAIGTGIFGTIYLLSLGIYSLCRYVKIKTNKYYSENNEEYNKALKV